jgi:hypothetical protein
MIRVNRGGLSQAEINDILQPLSPNHDSSLDITNISGNFDVALERYGATMDDAIAQIDRGVADGR